MTGRVFADALRLHTVLRFLPLHSENNHFHPVAKKISWRCGKTGQRFEEDQKADKDLFIKKIVQRLEDGNYLYY